MGENLKNIIDDPENERGEEDRRLSAGPVRLRESDPASRGDLFQVNLVFIIYRRFILKSVDSPPAS